MSLQYEDNSMFSITFEEISRVLKEWEVSPSPWSLY